MVAPGGRGRAQPPRQRAAPGYPGPHAKPLAADHVELHGAEAVEVPHPPERGEADPEPVPPAIAHDPLVEDALQRDRSPGPAGAVEHVDAPVSHRDGQGSKDESQAEGRGGDAGGGPAGSADQGEAENEDHKEDRLEPEPRGLGVPEGLGGGLHAVEPSSTEPDSPPGWGQVVLRSRASLQAASRGLSIPATRPGH